MILQTISVRIKKGIEFVIGDVFESKAGPKSEHFSISFRSLLEVFEVEFVECLRSGFFRVVTSNYSIGSIRSYVIKVSELLQKIDRLQLTHKVRSFDQDENILKVFKIWIERNLNVITFLQNSKFEGFNVCSQETFLILKKNWH